MAGQNDNIDKYLQQLLRDMQQSGKYLQGIMRDLQNSASMMSDLTEKLSKSGVNKFVDDMKDNLRVMGLVRDSDLKYIKNAENLRGTLADLEKEFERIKEVEQERRKSLADEIKTIRKQIPRGKTRDDQIDISRKLNEKAILKDLDMTKDHYEAVKNGLPQIRKEIEERARGIGAMEKFRKETDKLSDSVKGQAKSFFTLSTATDLAKKAFFKSYDQMSSLTKKGMLGAIGTINTTAVKLLMSGQEFEDIIAKNRNLINTLGGGVKGIEEFAKDVGDVGDKLLYLGRDAYKTGAELIAMNKNMGLTSKDGQLYRDSIKRSISNFKEFNGMFGDTIEQYTALYDQQVSEEQLQNKLNTMNKTEIYQYQEELQTRTKLLKTMGYSNEQIVEFNKKLANLYDPKKDTMSDRASDAAKTLNAHHMMIQDLQRGSPEEQETAKELQNMTGVLEKYVADIQKGVNSQTAKDNFLKNGGAKYSKSLAKGSDFLDLKDVPENRATQSMLDNKMAGALISSGQQGVTAEREGRDMTSLTADEKRRAAERGIPEEQALKNKKDELEQRSKDLQAAQSKTADALIVQARAIETVTSLLNNPLALAIGAGIAGLGALAISAGVATASLTALSGAAGAGGLLGSLGKFGLMLGKFAKVGGPLAAVAGVGLGAYGAYDAKKDYENGEISEKQKNKQMAEGIGTAVGTAVGGVIGTMVGGPVGLMVGSTAGGMAGSAVGGWLGNSGSDRKIDNPTTNATDSQRPKSTKKGREVSGKITQAPIATGTAAPILDAIGKAEGTDSKRGYNEVYAYGEHGGKDANLANMTISEVQALQKQMLNNQKSKGIPEKQRSSAVGRYQFISGTLAEEVKGLGLDPDKTNFTPEVQDQLAYSRLVKRGLNDYLNGKISQQQFMLNLSKEFASLPDPTKGGQGYYSSSHGQSSRMSMDEIKGAIDKTKTNVQADNQKKRDENLATPVQGAKVTEPPKPEQKPEEKKNTGQSVSGRIKSADEPSTFPKQPTPQQTPGQSVSGQIKGAVATPSPDEFNKLVNDNLDAQRRSGSTQLDFQQAIKNAQQGTVAGIITPGVSQQIQKQQAQAVKDAQQKSDASSPSADDGKADPELDELKKQTSLLEQMLAGNVLARLKFPSSPDSFQTDRSILYNGAG